MIGRRALFALAAGAAVACGRKKEPGPAATERVVLGISLLRISQPVFVAIERGLFAKRGLDVEVRRFDTAQPLADELAAGRIDAGGYVAFPILFGAGGPPPRLRLVTGVVEDAKHRISYLLRKKGSDVKDVASLRGKRVAILPTVAYRKWLEAVLKHDGVDPSTVTITPVAPPLEVDGLASGGYDALFTGDPMATAALARGVAEPVSDAPEVPRVLGDPFLFAMFALGADFAAKRPNAAAALRDALDDAIAVLAGDPSAGRAAMKAWLRGPELPFADRYPDTRFLASRDVTPAVIDRALELAGSSLRAADVTMP